MAGNDQIKYEYFEKDNACQGESSIGYFEKLIVTKPEVEIYGSQFKSDATHKYAFVGYYPGSKVAVVINLYGAEGTDAPDHDFTLVAPNGRKIEHVSFPWPSSNGDQFIYSISGSEHQSENGLYWFKYSPSEGFGQKNHPITGKSVCDLKWNDDASVSMRVLESSSHEFQLVKSYIIK